MATRNSNNTPEQKITPSFDDKYRDCHVCNGTGRVIVWSGEEDEDETPESERCPECEGEGKIEKEGEEDEW